MELQAGLWDFLAPKGYYFGSDQQLKFVIHFENRIDIETMEKTLHAITYIDPVIGCRYEQKEGKGYYVRREGIDDMRICEVIETEDAEAAVLHYVTEEIDPWEVPHLRACVVRSPESDTFCIRINHVLADGGGIKEIAYLIANTYNQLSENPSMKFEMGRYKPRTIIGLLEDTGTYKHAIDSSEVPPGSPFDPMVRFKPAFVLPTRENGNKEPDYAIRKISPTDFIKLKNFGKRYNATINDLLLSALVRTLCRISKVPEGVPFTVQVSSDNRSKFPNEIQYPIGNFFSVNFPELYWHEEDTFEDTLIMVRDQMSKVRLKSRDLESAVREEIAMMNQRKAQVGNQHYKKRETSDTSIKTTGIIHSNFTILDEDRLQFSGLKIKEVYELGTISFGREFMLGVSTYKNQLTFSTGYCHSNIEQSDIEQVMDSIASELYYTVNQM